MKEQYKKSLKDLGNLAGYLSSIGLVAGLGTIFYQIWKYGEVSFSEPSLRVLLAEIGITGGSITFLLYKLIKNLKDRYSLKG
ncbi:MAG: hypothetical protein V3V33_12495 [Candidatus Lokiarchaeia archaeon]